MLDSRTSILIAAGCVALAGAAAVTVACVRADDRPPPGTLTLTVSPSPAVDRGIMTADGWTITFDRVVVAIGGSGLGDGCSIYGEANYDRILDVTHTAAQKLGILYGIGQCDIDFKVEAPSADALLGTGVTEEDKTRLRTPGGDHYVPLGGVATEIGVTAARGGVTKHVTLSTRSRIRYRDCFFVPDSGAPAVNLTSNVVLTYDLRVEGEAILRDDVDAAAALRFDPFANADTNGDGVVTLEELRAVPIANVRDGGAFEAGTYEVNDAGTVQRGAPIVIETLGDYVYQVLAPTLVRYRDTGTCVPTQRRQD
jgi:hypothetical protein